MLIGIISAMKLEAQYIIDHLDNKQEENVNDIKFSKGNIGKIDIVVAISGIGKVNSAITTSLLISKYNPLIIINSGIAAGVNLELKDIILIEKLTYSDVDVLAFGYEFGQVPGMPLYYYPDQEFLTLLEHTLDNLKFSYKKATGLTADTFRSDTKGIKNNIEPKYAVEMEGTSIAQTCYKLKTKFIAIRYISDILDTDNHLDDYNAFEKEASIQSAKITLEFIKKIS